MRTVTKAHAAVVAGLSVGLALLAPAPAAADPSPLDPNVIYNYGENETPRSAAMGGALRALGFGTSAIFTNPAALSEVRLYHIQALAQVTPETGRQVYGGTIVDSVTSRLAGSFSFLGGFMDPSGIDRGFLDLRLALSFPFSDKFMLGLGGRYLKVTQSGLGPFGLSQVSGGLMDVGADKEAGKPTPRLAMMNTLTWDAGIVIRPTDSLFIAVVGQNLTWTKSSLMPLTVGGGIGYGGESFSIEADGIADITSWNKPTARIGLGGEYVIAQVVPIRLGYKFDQGAKLHTLSVGTGYVGPVFSAEATVKRTISNPGETMMVFSLAYHLESSGLTKAAQPAEATQQ